MKKKQWVVVAVGLAMAWSGNLWGQDYQATIQGVVHDPGGAPVAGVQVSAVDLMRKVSAVMESNAAGRFFVAHLLPGNYQLTVRKPGFRTVVRGPLSVVAGGRTEISIALELGPVSESVTVTGEATGLDTESASRSGAVESRVLQNVPSGGRNPFALEYSQPGVVKTSTYWGAMELYATSNVNNVQIGGGRNGENETVVDGVPATRTDRGIAYVPPLATVGELVVHTNAYDAQYGRSGGGVSSFTLRSGTNQFHGQLFEFLKNEKIRANDWVANKDGQPGLPFKNNTFGFAVDGPVLKNRVFFLLSYEGLRERSFGGQLRTLPTEAMKAGDFSKVVNSAGEMVRIYDPLSAVLQGNGQYLRQAMPGNVIPPSRMNPIASKVATFYPKANLVGDGLDGLNNYARISPAKNGYDAWLGKVDYYANGRNRVSAKYGQTPWETFQSPVWGDNAAEPSTSYPATRVQRTWGADWVGTVSPALVVTMRSGLARYEAFRGNSFGGGFDPASLGFPSALVKQFSSLMFPRFTLGTYSDLGANGVRQYETHDTWSLAPGVSWVRGRHVVRAGADFRLYRDTLQQPGTASGTYSFSKAWTQANPLRADAASGNEFASFLLGYPSGGNVPLNIDPALQSRYWGLYAADDFKVARKVTLSYGLRWDFEAPYVERYDRMISGFAPEAVSPIAGYKGGLLFAGKDGSRYAFDAKPWNFQPKVGVAWHVAESWVVRGGYGLSQLGQSSSGQQGGFSRTTTMVTTLDGGIRPAANLSDPFPTSLFPDGLLKPVGNSLGLSTNLGQAVTAPWRDRPLPYSHQYSVGLERELPGRWLVDVAYQGNLTRRLPVALGLNFIPAAAMEAVPVEQRASYFSAAVPNPMAGFLPGTGLNGATVPRQQLLFTYPQYAGVTVTDVPIGRQRYDGLLVKATQRMWHGLTLTVSFAVPKTLEAVSVLNAQDVNLGDLRRTKLEKRLAQFDVSQQFSVIGSYAVPVPGQNRWVRRVAGGWTVSGFFMSHSGFPMDFPNAAPLVGRSAKLSDDQRDAAARVLGRSEFDVSYDKWYDTTLFPRVAGPAPFTLRNFPTRFPDVRTKPLNVVDFSVYREFRLREGVRWQVRVDAHNAGNFPWFGVGQSNNVTNGGFGQLRADMGNEGRVVVGVMKVVF